MGNSYTKSFWIYIIAALAVAIGVWLTVKHAPPASLEPSISPALATYVNAEGQKWQIPKGDYEFTVTSAEKYPKMVIGFINPLDVKVGDVQKMMIAVNSDAAMGRAWAEVETDNDTKTVELKLTGTSTVAAADMFKQPYLVDAKGFLIINDGKNSSAQDLVKIAEAKAPIIQYRYEGEWTVADTHTKTYHTKFNVEDTAGRSDSMTLAWSDPVCNFDSGGNLIIGCNPSAGVEGFDGGDMHLNGKTITLGGSATKIAYNGGANGGINIGTGQITQITGGVSLVQTYMYFGDADGDLYASSTEILTNSSPTWAGHVRLKDVAGNHTGWSSYQVPNTASLDCDEYNNGVNPGITTYASSTIVDTGGTSAKNGTWDYNCSGAIEGVYSTSLTAASVSTGYATVYNTTGAGGCYSNSFVYIDQTTNDCGGTYSAENACGVASAPLLKEFGFFERIRKFLMNEAEALPYQWKGWYSDNTCAVGVCLNQTLKGFCR